MHGQQRRTQAHRKRDDEWKPEAEENQGVDMIGAKNLRGMKKNESHNDLVDEGGTKMESKWPTF